jgi:hypothetical protein
MITSLTMKFYLLWVIKLILLTSYLESTIEETLRKNKLGFLNRSNKDGLWSFSSQNNSTIELAPGIVLMEKVLVQWEDAKMNMN